mgnify:CR=1 FL=1
MNKLKLKQTIKEEIYKVLNEGIFSKKEYPLYTIEDSNDNFFQYVKNEHELGTNIDYITINPLSYDSFTDRKQLKGYYSTHTKKGVNTYKIPSKFKEYTYKEM